MYIDVNSLVPSEARYSARSLKAAEAQFPNTKVLVIAHTNQLYRLKAHGEAVSDPSRNRLTSAICQLAVVKKVLMSPLELVFFIV